MEAREDREEENEYPALPGMKELHGLRESRLGVKSRALGIEGVDVE